MKIRLKEAAFINNHRYERGDIVDLPDGVKGPHRAVSRGHERIDYSFDPAIDAQRILPEIVDEPLFEVVEEAPK